MKSVKASLQKLVEEVIGKKVNYIRIDKDGNEVSGEGEIDNVFRDTDHRAQVGVKDGAQRFNIDLPAIDATAEDATAYFAHVRAIRARADEINTAIKELATKGNAEIEKMNNKFLGEPLGVDNTKKA